MKFLSNFDTQVKKNLLLQYSKIFGDQYVMSIQKSKYYYWRYIGIPLFIYTVLFIISLYLVLNLEGLPDRGIWAFFCIFGLYGLILWFKVGRKWIDYKMDFLIVTPEEVIKYEQTGLFDRNIKKIHTHKIESVMISKPGVWNSIFDIGTLIFSSEGEDISDISGSVTLEYVDAIEDTDKKITNIIRFNKKKKE